MSQCTFGLFVPCCSSTRPVALKHWPLQIKIQLFDAFEQAVFKHMHWRTSVYVALFVWSELQEASGMTIKCPIHHNRQSHSALSVNRILPYLSLLFISCAPCQLYFSSNSSTKGSIALQAVEWDSWRQLFRSAGCHRHFSVRAFGQALLVSWLIWHLAGPLVVLFGRNSTESSLSNNKTEGSCPDCSSS